MGWGSVMALDAGTALERSVLSSHRNEDYYFTLRAIAASADNKLRFLRTGAKACCVPITILLVIAALGPAKWAPRTELGWRDSSCPMAAGTFILWSSSFPAIVGGTLPSRALLEAARFNPDRSFDPGCGNPPWNDIDN